MRIHIHVHKRAHTQGKPVFLHGYVEDSPLLATAGETFQLRKLLPQVVWAGLSVVFAYLHASVIETKAGMRV